MTGLDNMTSRWNNSTWHNTTTTEAPAPKIDFNPIRTTYFVGLGVIIPIGFIFNTLAIVVLASSRKLRNSTTGLYLIALSVADNLFLVGEFIRWLDNPRLLYYQFETLSDSSCYFVYSLRYGAKLTSAWITVAITAERFFIITFPLKAAVFCTKKFAAVVITVTYIICFILGCYPVLCLGIREHKYQKGVFRCFIKDHDIYHKGSWVVLRAGSLIIPGVFIILLTILIIINLSRAKMMRKTTLKEDQCVGAARLGRSSRALEKQLTAMLLAVAISFIILRLPYTILFYINEYKEKMWIPLDKYFSYQIYVATKIMELLAVLNYAVNFFLYCITGSAFRCQLRVLFGCKGPEISGRRSSMSAITRNTIVSNDKIALTVMNKAKNGHRSTTKISDSLDSVKDALNAVPNDPTTDNTEQNHSIVKTEEQ